MSISFPEEQIDRYQYVVVVVVPDGQIDRCQYLFQKNRLIDINMLLLLLLLSQMDRLIDVNIFSRRTD